MIANNVLGLVFSNIYDDRLRELTALRTMGSVPFGGRYRLIDFPLSNMVNCGIEKVGVITKSNYRSLMDHVGNGRPWDLARKRDGLFILPPFNAYDSGFCGERLEALKGISFFLQSSSEEYVVMTDCNVVCNIDYVELLNKHIDNNADITLCYAKGEKPVLENLMTFELNDNGRVNRIELSPDSEKDVNYALNITILKKSLLERLINEAVSQNLGCFERDILQNNIHNMNIYGIEIQGFCRTVFSLNSYFQVSKELLTKENRIALFSAERPIYTKIRDDMPVIYGLDCDVKNSLVADGCIIEGEVENCILFRGAKVSKNAIVKNSIIMQGAYIGESSALNCVIMDKDVVIKPKTSLSGAENYPFYVGKGIVI